MSTTSQTKLLIGAISILPYILVLSFFLIPVYIIRKQTLLGAPWKDGVMWAGSVFVYYGISVGLMFLPWPSISTN